MYMTASRGEGRAGLHMGLLVAEALVPVQRGIMPSLSLPTEDWGDQKCMTALPYICKRSNGTAVKPSLFPVPAATSGGCPQGWLPFLSKVPLEGEGTAGWERGWQDGEVMATS